jgi:hypothetical protein
MDSSSKGKTWTDVPFLIKDDWQEYLKIFRPKPLYTENLPLQLKTQWALYDLRDIIPQEYQEFYSHPAEPRPGAKTQSDDGRDVNIEDVETEGDDAELQSQSTDEQEEQKKKKENDSFLEELMLQLQETQTELTKQLLAENLGATKSNEEQSSTKKVKATTDDSVSNMEESFDEEVQIVNKFKKRRQNYDELCRGDDTEHITSSAKRSKTSEWADTWGNADAVLGPRGTGRLMMQRLNAVVF